MHLGVTGTRDGMTELQFNVFNYWIQESRVIINTLHEGDCIGFDHQITCMFKDTGNVIIHRHPPLKKNTQAHGPYDITEIDKDYLVRDLDIVNASGYLWANPNGPERMRGSGTWATIRMARKKGIPISIVMPNGEIIYEN